MFLVSIHKYYLFVWMPPETLMMKIKKKSWTLYISCKHCRCISNKSSLLSRCVWFLTRGESLEYRSWWSSRSRYLLLDDELDRQCETSRKEKGADSICSTSSFFSLILFLSSYYLSEWKNRSSTIRIGIVKKKITR